MAGIFTYRTINFDVPNGAPAVVYTVPANTQTFLTAIVAVNENVLPQTVDVQIQPSGGTARRILDVAFPLTAASATGSTLRDRTRYLLATGDAVLMGASVATDVKGTLTMAEET